MLVANMSIKEKSSLHKVKKRRRIIAGLILLFLIVVICYIIFHARDYEKKYQIANYQVTERFDKNLEVYSFEIQKENQSYHFVVPSSYNTKHKLITNISEISKDNTTCIILESAQLNTYPQCMESDKPISYHLIKEELKSELDAKYFPKLTEVKSIYEKIDIKNLDNNTYYIWNYKGFYVINSKEKKVINLFEKDIYDLKLTQQVDQFIVLPDYNANHYFNKFYFINTKDNKSKTWEFKDSLYFDGYFLGKKDGSLFYVDRKEKIEWEISPNREKMRKVGTSSKDGKIYQNGWEKVSLYKLVNETLSFEEEQIYHYEINNGLYVKYLNCDNLKKVSNQNVKSIVKVLKDKVYYLVGDALYYYSESTGEVLVMNYFEWNFNYKNMIFIYES